MSVEYDHEGNKLKLNTNLVCTIIVAKYQLHYRCFYIQTTYIYFRGTVSVSNPDFYINMLHHVFELSND